MATLEQVSVHPLVLLSVVDHYNRVARDTKKRVVGVLLGSRTKDEVDVTNSFAVPFEEDSQDPTIWFMDHSYMENMSRMFRKVNARETIVGWYSTGPKLRAADLDIHSLIAAHCADPVLVICEVQPKEVGLPIHAYVAREQVKPEGTEKAQHVFVHVPTAVRHTEVEEIGVEHLLKDVKDSTISTLSTEVAGKAQALKGLKSRLGDVQQYLDAVLAGTLPANNEVLGLIQDMFNLLPNLNVSALSQSLTVASNDMMMSVYLASLMRSVVALHSLIENKEARAAAERAAAAAEAQADADAAAAAEGAAEGKEKENADANGAAAANGKADSDSKMDGA